MIGHMENKISLKSRHETHKKDVVPGPGAYESVLQGPTSPIFSLRSRMQTYLGNANPGVGSYNLDFKRLNGLTIGVKPSLKMNNTNPGPGQYNLPTENTNPKFSMQFRP